MIILRLKGADKMAYVKLELRGDIVVARFDPNEDNGNIRIFWDDDLCEIAVEELTENERIAVLDAVGIKLVELAGRLSKPTKLAIQ